MARRHNIRPLIDRLMERIAVVPGDGCWEWIGYVHPTTGYGMFTVKAVGTRPAHRWVYEQIVGPIPTGFQIDHLCRNRGCVRPDHLEAVTPRENTLRSSSAEATRARATARGECRNGHAYTAENTARDGKGARRCRACAREAARRYRLEDPQRFAEARRRWAEKKKRKEAA